MSGEHGQADGAQFAGAQSEQEAAQAVQRMFNQIAPKYDRLNHLLSAGLDRRWWRRAARRFDGILRRPEARVLDICCGTGDLTLALLERRPATGEKVVALDFAPQMLRRGEEKFHAAGVAERVTTIEADAMRIPAADASFDLVVSAFGFRNLANYAGALTEIHRVLRPGGEIGILEINRPRGVLGRMYLVYFERVLPWIGRRVSGSGVAYEYLPASVARFPQPDRMLELMRGAGFEGAEWEPYTLGAVGLYRGRRV